MAFLQDISSEKEIERCWPVDDGEGFARSTGAVQLLIAGIRNTIKSDVINQKFLWQKVFVTSLKMRLWNSRTNIEVAFQVGAQKVTFAQIRLCAAQYFRLEALAVNLYEVCARDFSLTVQCVQLMNGNASSGGYGLHTRLDIITRIALFI